jgi:secreted trypsin-like serine protease
MGVILLFVFIFFSSINSIFSTTYTCDPSMSCGCASSSTTVTARIIGGEAAPNHAWGWIVSYQIYGGHSCGASLLTPEYAVTAAHCVVGYQNDLSALTIVAGTNYLNDVSSTVQQRTVTNAIVHPDYNSTTVTNDIAIIQFAPLQTSPDDNIAFICLPQPNVDPFQANSDLVAIGWGVTIENSTTPSNFLQQVTVQDIASTTPQCLESGITNFTVQFCAGIITGGKGKFLFYI